MINSTNFLKCALIYSAVSSLTLVLNMLKVTLNWTRLSLSKNFNNSTNKRGVMHIKFEYVGIMKFIILSFSTFNFEFNKVTTCLLLSTLNNAFFILISWINVWRDEKYLYESFSEQYFNNNGNNLKYI